MLFNPHTMSNLVFPQFLMGKNWQVPTLAGLFLLGVNALSLPTLAQQPTLEPQNPPVSAVNNSTPTTTDYTLGPGDRLRIDIFQVQDYTGEYQVLVDGTVNMPLAGAIKVQGLTMKQAAELVAQKYAPYVKRPIVTVSLLDPRPLKIAIAGEVNRPGSYEVSILETQQFPTVTDILQLAGGLTTAADIHQVKIRRFFNGREKVLTVNLWELLQQGNLNQDISLRDGDAVFVPTTDKIDIAETLQLADANFGIQATEPIDIAVVGEVYRPGSYELEPQRIGGTTDSTNPPNNTFKASEPPTLTQAIAQAGGIKPLADIRRIEVRRHTRAGSQQTLEVNLWEMLQTGDISNDVILQQGDTIVIPKAENLDPTEAELLATASFAPDTIRVNVVGEVDRPGVVEVPPNTPLNQALMAAGGFDERRAAKSSVELIRLNPDGTVSKRGISVDFAKGINEQTNPALRNNDVIVVSRSGLATVTDTLGTVLSPFNLIFNPLNRIFR